MTLEASLRARARREGEQGIAIITVLAVLLLMSVLVLAFFQMASNEYIASNNYDYGIRSRQAADTVVSIVTGQIRKATTQTDAGGVGRFAWASQPGAITTFRTKSEYQEYEDAAFIKYKLYSSDKMIADGDDNLANDVPPDWDEHPELYVDLNAPVVEESGQSSQPRLHFPIIDPRAFVASTYNESSGVDNQNGIAGFAFSTTSSAGHTIAGVKSGTGPDARLPMPVRWLYMLADGTIGHLDDAGKFVRSFGEGNVTRENPVTQRFAFWTDDDTNKINVNTASEGQYWNYPQTASTKDKDFAKYIPAQNEIQRFPGQPGTTSLSVVFDPRSTSANAVAIQKAIYKSAPKVEWGGTEDGTKPGTAPVVLDTDRLYATEDEYLFGSAKGANSTAELRQSNELFRGSLATEQELERARFFLTASSSAPETTLIGTPRISMWGLPENPGQRSRFDNLLAYCSTLPKQGVAGSQTYFFRRSDSTSRHWEIYIHGNGANLRLLQNYMWPLTSLNNPPAGFGGSFAAKYGNGPFQDRRQICTAAFDFLRNINPGESNYFGAGPNSKRYGQSASSCICGGSGPHNTVWSSQRNAFPKGFGRMYSLSEAALVFICTADFSPNGSKGDARNLKGLPPNHKRIQAALVLEAFCPAHGYVGIIPNTRMQVIDGSEPLKPTDNTRTNPPPIWVEGANRAAPWWVQNRGSAPFVVGNTNPGMVGRHTWGGAGGMRMFLTENEAGTGKGIAWMTADPSSPSVEQDGHIVVPSGNSTLNIEETTMRIILYDDAGSQDTGNLIQAFDVVFPEMKIPVPEYPGATNDSWQKRIARSNKANGEDELIMGGNKETVRSVVVSHGDYRLINARRVVKKLGSAKGDAFQPHPDYATTNTHAHSLVRGDGSPVKEAKFAPLVRGVTYAQDIQPDFPTSPTDPNFHSYGNPADPYFYQADPTESGDFDTGLGLAPDGAYINRPDEGSAAANGAGYYDHNQMKTTVPLSGNRLTPNRLISGPVQFGSLSTGVQANIPWRTLLFRPDPRHFGAKHDSPLGMVPPDHLFLDLFWMPVVEPYAISAPFATAGKVNLNCQIAPFDYIKRQTALHAVLKGERVIAIPNGHGTTYKSGGGDYYKEIDAVQTLRQFEDRFKRGELFRSGSEICEIYLVPKGQQLGSPQSLPTPAGDAAFDYPQMRDYWAAHKLTGDNLKERPYAGIYPRVTTKSNSFRVHMIVQHLKKARSSDPEIFDPEIDRVTSQWRGSAQIERNIDPNNPKIPDYYTSGTSEESFNAKISKPSLEYFYNYRVLNVRQFAP